MDDYRGHEEEDPDGLSFLPTYSADEQRAMQRVALEWGRIRDMPAREFMHLDLDRLNDVELAAAADRFDSRGEGRQAIAMLRRLVTTPAKSEHLYYEGILADLIDYHAARRRFDEAIDFENQLIGYYMAQGDAANEGDMLSARLELAELYIEKGDAGHGRALIDQIIAENPDDPDKYRQVAVSLFDIDLDDEAIEYLNKGIDVAEQSGDATALQSLRQLLAEVEEDRETAEMEAETAEVIFTEDDTSLTGEYLYRDSQDIIASLGLAPGGIHFRPGGTIDWYDYLEQIKIFLNRRMFLAMAAEVSDDVRTAVELVSSLVASAAIQGMAWTTLTRPNEVVVRELADFTQAVASLQLPRVDSVPASMRTEYEELLEEVEDLQDGVGALRFTFERYFKGQYDGAITPEELIRRANKISEVAPQMALPLIGEAGALLLVSEPRPNDELVILEDEAEEEIYPWVRAMVFAADALGHCQLLPLAAAAEERGWWQRQLAQVPLGYLLHLPDLWQIGAKVRKERRQEQKRAQKAAALAERTARAQQPGATRAERPRSWGKVKPNEPCPCGSGKKFKKCCGRPVS